MFLDNSTIVVASTAVVCDKCPIVAGVVRAETLTGGYIIYANENDRNTCKVSYITHVDLKGKLLSIMAPEGTLKNIFQFSI